MESAPEYPPHARRWPATPPKLPPAMAPPRKPATIHVILFLATLATTTAAGAFHQGADLLGNPSSIVTGLPFSLTLLLILLCHEMGHYLLARWHRIPTTLPYFIPGPPVFVGTFGAFIRMQGMPRNRAALFDVGAAGPWAGMVVAVPAVALGLSWSEIQPLEVGAALPLTFGSSFLFAALSQMILGVDSTTVTVLLHPVAMAGWFGFFVTFLNLLPVGQLDGGHVAYAWLGSRHRLIARGFVVVLLGLAFLPGGWNGWLLWAAILFFILRVDHPDTADRDTPLDPKRRLAAWATAVIFVGTFMPIPLIFNESAFETETQRLEQRDHRRERPPRHRNLLEVNYEETLLSPTDRLILS